MIIENFAHHSLTLNSEVMSSAERLLSAEPVAHDAAVRVQGVAEDDAEDDQVAGAGAGKHHVAGSCKK